MFEPDKAKIPDGCNFIIWFESDRSPEELLKAFEFKKWQAKVGNSGFTLTQIVPIKHMRNGGPKNYQINMAAMVTVEPSCLSVLAGNCTYPESIGAEFRKLVLRLEGQSNNLFCLYIKGGTLWREVPASAELLGMDSCSLSDGDRAALNTGYIVQRTTDSCMTIDGLHASSSSVQELQSEVRLLSPSVVVDEEGYTHITCRPYTVVRRLWNQVREVGLYPEWGPNLMFVNNYVWVKGEGFEDLICLTSGCFVSEVGPARGVSEFLNRLDVLPGFSLKDLEEALKTLFVEEELVWKRSDSAVNEDLQV